MGKFSCKLVTSPAELQEGFDVRRRVFVHEQGISEGLVFDGQDGEALHVVVKHGEKVVGTARVQFLNGDHAKLERMAILKDYRRKGVGREMLLFLEPILRHKQIHQVIIHAQLEVTPFYRSCGFHQEGLPFQEAGIPHVKMRKQL